MILTNRFRKEFYPHGLKDVAGQIQYFNHEENRTDYSFTPITTKHLLKTTTFNLQNNAKKCICLKQGDGDNIRDAGDPNLGFPIEEQIIGSRWQEMYTRKVAELKPENVNILMHLESGGYAEENAVELLRTGALIRHALDDVRVLIVDNKYLVAWTRVGKNKDSVKQVGEPQSEAESITFAYYMKRDDKRNEEVFDVYESHLADLVKRSEPVEVIRERIKKNREFGAEQAA